jgi:UDP-glucose 4-epimerase
MASLVTGGAGFIGSNLVDALLDRGEEVTVLDDLSTGRRANVEGASANGARLVEGDIRDGATVREVIEATGPGVIYHLAAQIDVRRSIADPRFDLDVNGGGTVELLEAARAAGIARFVFASTGGAIYGEGSGRELPFTEDADCRPDAPYGESKLTAEGYVGLYERLYGLSAASLRLGNVFGPRQDPAGEAGVVSIFSGRVVRDEPLTIFGDGTQTRDYVWVGDVVQAFLAAAAAGRGGTWNVGTGVETSVLDLVDGLAKATGKRIEPQFAPARAGELQASALDASALARDLGVSAQVAVGDGLPRVYAWVAAGEPARGALA